MDKFNFLVDSSFNLLEASEKNEASLTKAIKKIEASTRLLKSSVTNIERRVASSTETSSIKSAELISKEVLSQLNEVNKSAEKAALTYKNAAKFSVIKLGGMFFLFFLLAGGLLWLFFIKEIPTIDEIHSLKEAKKMLEQDISKLRSYGDLASCGEESKPCVKVNLSRKYGNDDIPYYVILPKE